MHGVVHQAGDRERLAVLQFELGLGAARRERRDAEALQDDGVGEVQRADLGPNLQVHAVADDRRREVQPDAELLELNGDRDVEPPEPCATGRELAAGEEARFLAALGNQVRLGEALEQALVLQRAGWRRRGLFFVSKRNRFRKSLKMNLPSLRRRSPRRGELLRRRRPEPSALSKPLAASVTRRAR